MVGSAIIRRLQREGYDNLKLRTHAELDLLNQHDVNLFFQSEKPEFVFIAAAKVGGILANNTYRGQFLYENLMIQMERNAFQKSSQYSLRNNMDTLLNFIEHILYNSKNKLYRVIRLINSTRIIRLDYENVFPFLPF